jgi:hypothetical protein
MKERKTHAMYERKKKERSKERKKERKTMKHTVTIRRYMQPL